MDTEHNYLSDYEEEWLDESVHDVEVKLKSEVKKKYTKEDLINALEEISGGSSIYAASKKFKVPESTLKSRFNFKRRDQSGRKPLLEIEIETKLAHWIIESAAIGDPRTKEEVLTAAAELSNLDKTQAKKDLLSNGWLTRFLKRNPKVSFRTPQAVTRSSANLKRSQNLNVEERLSQSKNLKPSRNEEGSQKQ